MASPPERTKGVIFENSNFAIIVSREVEALGHPETVPMGALIHHHAATAAHQFAAASVAAL